MKCTSRTLPSVPMQVWVVPRINLILQLGFLRNVGLSKAWLFKFPFPACHIGNRGAQANEYCFHWEQSYWVCKLSRGWGLAGISCANNKRHWEKQACTSNPQSTCWQYYGISHNVLCMAMKKSYRWYREKTQVHANIGCYLLCRVRFARFAQRIAKWRDCVPVTCREMKQGLDWPTIPRDWDSRTHNFRN